MPASEASSRRSSMTVTDVKAGMTLLDSKGTKSVSIYPKVHQTGTQSGVHPMVPKIANTYKLSPDADKRFRSKDVKDAIDSVLESRLEGFSYDAEKCKFLLPSIADEIKDKVKVMGFDRYKLVCLVTIGKLNNQGVRVASRCLWDTATDRLASSSFCGEDVFASAVVFGVYRE